MTTEVRNEMRRWERLQKRYATPQAPKESEAREYPDDGQLAALAIHEAAARMFFSGLLDRMAECIVTDRIDDWKKAGHLAVEYFSTDFRLETERR